MGEKTLISCIDYTYLTHAFTPPPSRKPGSEGRDQGDMDAQGQKGEAGAGSREVRTPFGGSGRGGGVGRESRALCVCGSGSPRSRRVPGR